MKKVDLINEKLKEKLITQREFAELIGINEVAMSRYLNGYREMPEELAERCLKAIEEVSK